MNRARRCCYREKSLIAQGHVGAIPGYHSYLQYALLETAQGCVRAVKLQPIIRTTNCQGPFHLQPSLWTGA